MRKKIKGKLNIRLLVLKIVFTTIFLGGFVAVAYPYVSNYFLERSQIMVINEYRSKVEEIADGDMAELKEKITQYNLIQSGTTLSIENLFEEEDNIDEVTAGNSVDENGNAVFDVMQSQLGPSIGSIRIPIIGLEAPIYTGTTEAVLTKGIGLLDGSSIPVGGESLHAVLTGHRGLPNAKLFTDLPKLVIGDEFYIDMIDETLAYEVDQILTVVPEDTEALRIEEGKDYVTLITCTPYMVNSHRLLVRGHRIPYIEEQKEDWVEAVINKGNEILKYKYVIVLGAFMVIPVARSWYLFKRRR